MKIKPGHGSTGSNLNVIADGYDTSSDFDIVYTQLATALFLPDCLGKDVLEVGCGMGEMTEKLLSVASSLDVIEPAVRYFNAVKDSFGSRLTMHHTILEEFTSEKAYQVVVIAGLLHHLPDPVAALQHIRQFLTKDGVLLISAPNAMSLHRQIGVQAGIIESELAKTERNIRFQQHSNFTKDSIMRVVIKAGFRILDCHGYMLKPFSSEQMTMLRLSPEVLSALNDLGRKNEHLSSQIYVKAVPNNGR